MKKILLLLIFSILVLSNLKADITKKEFNLLKEQAINSRDPEVQYQLGYCYLWGKGVKKNKGQAVHWYTQAAMNGDIGCQYLLGQWYERGENVKKDIDQALIWYNMAAENNHPEAQYHVGKYYENLNELDKAIEFYKLAAKNGSQDAKDRLNVIDPLIWYNMAADNNDPAAQYYLGTYYENMNELEKALEFYKLAAKNGDYLARNRLHVLDPSFEILQNMLSWEEINKKILTWDQYYDENKKRGLTYTTKEEIESVIRKIIEEWQVKSEFESTEEWKSRVSDETRQNKIKELKDSLLLVHEHEKRWIKDEMSYLYSHYKVYREKVLEEEYYDKIKYVERLKFSKENFILLPYDADNNSFMIRSENYGDILLPVPRNEAPDFKSNWDIIKKKITPVYMPDGPNVALTKLIFTNNGKEYVYDSHTKANYAITDVEYNFEPIEIADINLSDLKIDDFADIPQEAPSKIVTKTNSDVLTAQNVQVERKNISASEKSNVDTAIPNNNPLNNSTSFAVIIANENYHAVSNVPYASKDGVILEKYLTQAVGLPKDHVKIYNNASYGNMAAAIKHIENLSEAFGNELNLIFYYAGHGMANEKTKNPMLLPIDGDVAIPETCFELDKIISTLGHLNANSVVVMLDACFSGTERGDAMLMAARGIRIKSNNSQPIGNMVILSASQGDETAYPFDTEQHGLFTYFLLKKLQENNGDVTLGELSDYITDQVKRQSVVSNGKLQTPSVSISPELSSTWRNLKFGK